MLVPVEAGSSGGTPPKAVLMSGPPGAGKSSALAAVRQMLGDTTSFRVIDPDAFKDSLLYSSLRDGSHYGWLMPDDVWKLHQSGERFHPRELATLVHVESGRIADYGLVRAISAKADFLLDGTLSNETAARSLVAKLNKAGYETTIVNVECTKDQSLQRCHDRWLAGRHAAVRAEADERLGWDDRLGGRFVPPQFIDTVFTHPGSPDHSGPHHVAQTLMREGAPTRLISFRLHPGENQPQLESVTRWNNGRLITLNADQAHESLRYQQTRHSLGLTTPGTRPSRPGRPPGPNTSTGWTPSPPRRGPDGPAL